MGSELEGRDGIWWGTRRKVGGMWLGSEPAARKDQLEISRIQATLLFSVLRMRLGMWN